MSIVKTTMQGNNNTNPKGIEIEELPFNRIRRRKKDSCGSTLPFSLLRSSSEGTFGDDGIRFARPCKNPITLKDFSLIGAMSGLRPAAAMCVQLLFPNKGLLASYRDRTFNDIIEYIE